jgi:hypothetical protein
MLMRSSAAAAAFLSMDDSGVHVEVMLLGQHIETWHDICIRKEVMVGHAAQWLGVPKCIGCTLYIHNFGRKGKCILVIDLMHMPWTQYPPRLSQQRIINDLS